MILQENDLTIALEPLIAYITLLIFIVLMLYFYIKVQTFFPILLVELFSIILFAISLNFDIILTPFLQIFFICFQTSFFMSSGFKFYNQEIKFMP